MWGHLMCRRHFLKSRYQLKAMWGITAVGLVEATSRLAFTLSSKCYCMKGFFCILHSAFCIRLAQNWSENKASTKQGMVVLALSPPPSWIFLALAPFLRTARVKAEKLFVQERFLHRLLSSFSFLSFYKLTGNTAIEFHSHWDPTTPSHRIDPEISSRQRF